jgi:5,6,7,8-tetrahydromethanopterin hydro-lyase
MASGLLFLRSSRSNAEAVYLNNRAATRAALESGRRALPALDEILEARLTPENPFFPPRKRGSR